MTRRNLSIAFCLLMAGAVFAQNKPEHRYFQDVRRREDSLHGQG